MPWRRSTGVVAVDCSFNNCCFALDCRHLTTGNQAICAFLSDWTFPILFQVFSMLVVAFVVKISWWFVASHWLCNDVFVFGSGWGLTPLSLRPCGFSPFAAQISVCAPVLVSFHHFLRPENCVLCTGIAIRLISHFDPVNLPAWAWDASALEKLTCILSFCLETTWGSVYASMRAHEGAPKVRPLFNMHRRGWKEVSPRTVFEVRQNDWVRYVNHIYMPFSPTPCLSGRRVMCLAVSLHVAFTVAAAKSCGWFSDSVVIQYGLELVLSRAVASVQHQHARTKTLKERLANFCGGQKPAESSMMLSIFSINQPRGGQLRAAFDGGFAGKRESETCWLSWSSISLCDFVMVLGATAFILHDVFRRSCCQPYWWFQKAFSCLSQKWCYFFTIARIITQGSSCQQVSPVVAISDIQQCSGLASLNECMLGHVGASGIVSMGFGCLDVWSRFCSTKCRVDDAHPLFETYIKQTS